MKRIKNTKIYLKYRKIRKNLTEFFKFMFNFIEYKEKWTKNQRYLDNLKYEIYDNIRKGNINYKIPQIMPIEDTINRIIEDRKSLCRYGDGEFAIVTNINFNPKSYFNTKLNPELAKRLREILTNKDDNIIVCIPDIFGSIDLYSEFAQNIIRQHITVFRKPLEHYLNFNKPYGNSYITRFHSAYVNQELSEEYFKLIKKIWDEKDICIIEGSGSQLGVGNDLFDNAKSIERIICPAENAYAKYDEILDIAKQQSKDKLILIALGMAATVLAYDLAQFGFWAIDIGHIDLEYSWFIEKSLKL